MTITVWLAATGVTIQFVYTFLYLFYTRHTMTDRPGKHRSPDNKRRKRSEPVEIITTGEIYSAITDSLNDGFSEEATTDGGLINNEGWKTYPA